MATPDVDEVWSRFLVGDAISSNEEYALLRALETDEPRRRQLVQDEQIEGLLRSQGHCAVLEDQLIDQLSVRLSALAQDAQCDPPIESNRAVGEPAPGAAAAAGFNAAAKEQGAASRLLRSWPFVGAAIAVTLVLGIGIGYAVRGTTPGDGDRNSQSGRRHRDWKDAALNPPARNGAKSTRVNGNKPEPKRGPKRVDAETLARLQPSPNAVWDSPVAGELKAEMLKLRSGTASVTFEGGATVQLRGRTQLQLVSTGRASLLAGRLSVQVPRRAVGFTIDTPLVRVVDLGTEFDVDVDADGTTSVDVLRGRVELVPLHPDGNLIRRELTAGERVRIAPTDPGAPSSPPTSAPKASSGKQNPGACIVRGILIIEGQRFEYNSEAEYEQLRKRFPQLKPLHNPRAPQSGAPKRKRPPANRLNGSKTAPRKPNVLAVGNAARKPAVKRLCGIDWHPDLNSALKEAVRQDKPVMVFRVLGSLSGFM